MTFSDDGDEVSRAQTIGDSSRRVHEETLAELQKRWRDFDSHTDVCSLRTRMSTRVPELETGVFHSWYIIGPLD